MLQKNQEKDRIKTGGHDHNLERFIQFVWICGFLQSRNFLSVIPGSGGMSPESKTSCGGLRKKGYITWLFAARK